MSSAKAPVVVKGKLNLKGSGGKKRKAPESSAPPPSSSAAEGVRLTDAQLKHRRKTEADSQQTKRVAGQSYRERVETFNLKLSRQTEHNDIPRISAAGNG